MKLSQYPEAIRFADLPKAARKRTTQAISLPTKCSKFYASDLEAKEAEYENAVAFDTDLKNDF